MSRLLSSAASSAALPTTLELSAGADAPPLALLDMSDPSLMQEQCLREVPRDDTLQPDVFDPPLAQVAGVSLSDGDTDGYPSTSTRLGSTAPSSMSAPRGLVPQYLHFLASGEAFAASLSERTRSQENVMLSTDAITEKASHLSQPTASSSSTSLLGRRPLSPSPLHAAVNRAPFLVEPVFIQAATVNLLLTRLSDDVTALQTAHRQEVAMRVLEDSSPSLSPKTASATAMGAWQSAPLHMPYHNSIPKRLDLPLRERCAFCQKHDSMCSRCHAKWAAIQKDIRESCLRATYNALPLVKRTSLVFLLSAFGTGDLLAAQLFHDNALVSRVQSPYRVVAVGDAWHTALTVPPPSGASAPSFTDSVDALLGERRAHGELVEESVALWLQDRFDDAGAVHALHVALAHRNTRTTKTLLADPSVRFLSSSQNSVDPLSFLHCTIRDAAGVAVPDALLRVLNGSRECRQHIRSELAKAALREHHYSEVHPLVEDMQREDAEDERGLWLAALLDLAEKRYDDSQRRLQQLLRTSSQQPLVFLDKSQIHRLLADASKGVQFKTSRRGSIENSGAVIALRRLPFSLVRNVLLPFCTPITLLRIYEATTMPLLRAATTAVAATSPPRLLHAVLTDDSAHFGELVVALIDELPPTESMTDQSEDGPTSATETREDARVAPAVTAQSLPSALVMDGTLRPLNVHVLSMTDFCTLVIKLSMAGKRSRVFTEFLRDQDVPTSLFTQLIGGAPPLSACLRAEEVVLSRVFTIHRASVRAPWGSVPYTSWELDMAATASLGS